MATKPRTQVGVIDCHCCKRQIPVREAETGTLNVSCGWCDFSAYAKAGTEANRIVRAQMKAREGGDPLPLVTREPAPAAPPQPTPKPAAPVAAPVPKPEPAATKAPDQKRGVFW